MQLEELRICILKFIPCLSSRCCNNAVNINSQLIVTSLIFPVAQIVTDDDCGWRPSACEIAVVRLLMAAARRAARCSHVARQPSLSPAVYRCRPQQQQPASGRSMSSEQRASLASRRPSSRGARITLLPIRPPLSPLRPPLSPLKQSPPSSLPRSSSS